MTVLYLITARAGSKGLPGKNTKLLNGKALFLYSVDFARENMSDNDELCISTNDDELIDIAEKNNISIPFKRPEELSNDTANSRDVILHALEYYEKKGRVFDAVFLLQPTSPYRTKEDFQQIIKVYSKENDMVVSVKISKDNPYFNLFEEDESGFIQKSKKSDFSRRQDCPEVYAFNGSMYLINVGSIKRWNFNEFKKIKKVVMPMERSVDIDTIADWVLAEYYLQGNNNFEKQI